MKPTTVQIEELKGLELTEALRVFLSGLLESGKVAAVLVPKRTPAGSTVAQVLIAEPDRLEGIDPLAPIQMVNAAQVVRELAKEPLEQKIAAVLRPCEVRAVIELVKLKQASLESLYLIGYDCPGVYDLKDYLDRVEQAGDPDALRCSHLERFLAPAAGEASAVEGTAASELRAACRLCSHFTAESADLNVAWIGAADGEFFLQAGSDKGRALLAEAQEAREAPAGRAARIEALRAQRIKLQEELPQDLLSQLHRCIRCYNCREVCPICYCKECLLKPEKMGYSSQRYLRRAQKKGQIKMPVDTLLYHLTKMNHMACSCVACGLCEQACPMDIPLGSIYSRVGRNVQALFDYVPGRSLEEEMPVTTFREDELPGVEDIRR